MLVVRRVDDLYKIATVGSVKPFGCDIKAVEVWEPEPHEAR
jgi:hypothetical protein